MKQKKKLILISSCMLLSLFVGMGVSNKTNVANAAGEVSKTLLFGSSYNSKGVGNYTSTWSATNEGFTWNISHFNNNNNGWKFARAGSNNGASVATISTASTITDVISKVAVTIDSVTTSNVNSITLTVNDGTPIAPTGAIAAGTLNFDIATPVADANYTLTFNLKKGSKNGFVQVSKVEYFKGVAVADNEYSISFDANGGTFNTPADWDTKTYTKGETTQVVLPTEDVMTTKYGISELSGWSVGDQVYVPGTTVDVTDTTKFVAVYEGKEITVEEALSTSTYLDLNATTDIQFSTVGVIDSAYSTYADSWYITDESGTNKIIAFSATTTETISVGDKVKVTGYLKNYHDVSQYDSGCVIEKITEPSVSIALDGESNEVYSYDDGTPSVDVMLSATLYNATNYTITWKATIDGIISFDPADELTLVSAVTTGEVNVYAEMVVDGLTYKSNEILINSYKVTTLSKPTELSFSNEKVFSWKNVENADYYEVYYMTADGTISEVYKTEVNSFKVELVDEGTYTLSVKACSNSNLYKNSEEELLEVNVTLSAQEIIENTHTQGLLGFKYVKSSSTVSSVAKNTDKLTTAPTGNFADHLGLDKTVFSATMVDNGTTNTIFNNGSNETRLYAHNGNGTALTIETLNGSLIKNVVIHFGSKVSNYTLNGTQHTATAHGSSDSLEVNGTSFTIVNVGTVRLDITSIDINYEGLTESYTNIRMRFVANLEKEVVDSLGKISAAGVKVTAANKNPLDIQIDPSIIGEVTKEGKTYYTFIGTIKNIPVTAKDLEMTATAYVVINEKTYNLHSVTYSLNSMVDEYINSTGLLSAEEMELMNNFKNYLAK